MQQTENVKNNNVNIKVRLAKSVHKTSVNIRMKNWRTHFLITDKMKIIKILYFILQIFL